MSKQFNTVILCIMDGYGLYKAYPGNAIELAKKPNIDYLTKTYPHTKLEASNGAVGLPKGQMGNSEVGHLTLGSGRRVFQNLTLISHSIDEGKFYKNPALLNAINHSKKHNSNLHILGLYSDGGVHSHLDHINALIELAKRENIKNVYLHLFLDGRDTDPKSGKVFIEELEKLLTKYPNAHILTIGGRYYGMDRDKRWDRVQLAYDAMVNRKGPTFTSASTYIQSSYDKKVFDEFVLPAYNKDIDVAISDHDAIISANFRPDRIVQIASGFTNHDYLWKPEKKLNNLHFTCFTSYGSSVIGEIAFTNPELKNILGEILAQNNLKQLRIAETEKYAHVTYFFDGGVKVEYPGKVQKLIDSPKVTTYDLKPEMSATTITKELLNELKTNKYDVVILNFANCDMVGHTGMIPQTIKAVETVDSQVKQIYDYAKENNSVMLIVADHGNADVMLDEETLSKPITSHSVNPVPFIITSNEYVINKEAKCTLADIAPTILYLCNIKIPVEMEGKSLVIKK